MYRKKRSSNVLEKAEQRVIGFKSIDSNLDFGDSISLKYLTELNEQLRNKIDHYNMMLTNIDTTKGEIETLEKTICETSERLVNGVASRYGKNSREYEMTGGVRKSERIRKATITRLKKAEGRRQRAEGSSQKGIQTPPDLEPLNKSSVGVLNPYSLSVVAEDRKQNSLLPSASCPLPFPIKSTAESKAASTPTA